MVTLFGRTPAGPAAAVADLRRRRLLHQRRHRRPLRDHRAGVPDARARVRHRLRDRRRPRRLGAGADHRRLPVHRRLLAAGRRADAGAGSLLARVHADAAETRSERRDPRPTRHPQPVTLTHVAQRRSNPHDARRQPRPPATSARRPDDRPQPTLRRGPHERDRRLVARQHEAGLDIVNDGEYGKSSWANYVLDRMTGFEPRPDTLFEAVWLGRDRVRFSEFMKAEFPRGAVGSPGHACVGPIRYQGSRASAATSAISRPRSRDTASRKAF